RKLQKVYKLEPAGSHGVWGLDDYQFLPYYFGSSQFIGSGVDPRLSINDRFIYENKNRYLYIAAINWINQATF
ncbi:hypothetical protein BB560_003768, partial [Smittium megazygosporum]